MSTVSKLEIRGIRSFGCETGDVQKINFRSPLTVIVGQNGCGKTTIIECLKFGLTGELPPGTNRGVGFVHDPKIFNTIESMAQVKLMVTDVTGNNMTAIRSMKIKLTNKGKTSKFETLDSTLTMVNALTNAETILTRSRVADLNNEMCDAMGVSKAILNNVIFCHQEDSNWPLEEPKELKKRFDAIFGTTEYNVAAEKLVKIAKQYTERQKEKLGDLKLLKHIKQQADDKKLLLEGGEEKLTRLRQMTTDLDSDIEPIQKKLEQLALVERELSTLMAKKIEYSSKIKSKHEQQKQLKSKISQLFEGSLVELEAEIRIFQQTAASKQSELEEEESSLQSILSKERSLQGKLQTLDCQKIELLEKQKRERELQTDRGKKILTLGGKLKLVLLDDYGSANLEAVNEVLGSIRCALKKEETAVKSMDKAIEEEDVRAQKIIDKLRETKASLESECQSKRRHIEQSNREKQRTASELAGIERSAETLKRLIDEIDRLEREYEVQAKATNLPAMKQELTEKKELRDQLQDQLDRLDERVTALNEYAVKDRELTLKEQQCSGREAELRRLRNKHVDSLRRLFPDRAIESNYKRNIQDLYDTLQKEIKTMNEKIRRTNATVTEMETTRKNQKLQLERLQGDVAEAEEKIYAACRGNAYEDVLAKLSDKISKNNLEHGEARSAVVLYQKFISNIEKDRCCPVCDREMGGDDAQDISGKLADEIRRLPEKIESLERALRTDRLEYDRLLALKPVSERLEKQKDELAHLKQKLQDTERRLTTASDELEEYQLAVSEPSGNLQLISTIVGDMSILDETGKELERMKRGMEELKAELANKVPKGVTIESLKAERDAMREKLKIERRSVDELQTTLDAKTEKLNNLQSRNNQMKAKKLQLQESIQSLEQKRTKFRELETQIGTLEGELQTAEQRLQPVKEQLNSEVQQKQRSREANGQKLQKARKALEELNREDAEIIRLCCELEELAVLDLSAELNRLKLKMDQVKEERERVVALIEPKTKLIGSLKQDIANQQLRERDLYDNQVLKQLMRETSVLESDLEALLKSMGKIEGGNVHKERTRLLDLRDGLQGKRSELNGQISELQRQLNDLRKELSKSEFQNALSNYKKTFYEAVVLRKICSDIKKYRDALEWALREYHTEMMKTINQSIFSLWRDIYRGNDIDYIRINTEDEEGVEQSEKRRVYSYRVVQAKNDVEIDMRGRCSAGQKVLASLIIRLALAEAFCSKCGVMALDEPTTNLDRDNIESLCVSLREIVTERQHGNFLFIVITHDEEFATKLDRFETYYRISRNDKGKSVIKEEQL